MHQNIVELERQVRIVKPDFLLEAWNTTNPLLAKSIERFKSEVPLADKWVAYLAERVYLDCMKNEDATGGIKRYLEQKIHQRFKDHGAKLKQLEDICRDAQSATISAEGNDLMALLNSQHVTEPLSLLEYPVSINELKLTNKLQRSGDVVFLPAEADVVVIGDTHGDLHSTQQILEKIAGTKHLEQGGYIVFLGDYVNNGVRSWETIQTILNLQKNFPNSVVLLNGNHEFEESYLTALNEYFGVHWDRFAVDDLPVELQNRVPEDSNHYGHFRLELIREFGFTGGEQLYTAYANWGLKRPLTCVTGKVMISHSLGKPEGMALSLNNILNGKQDDIDDITNLGFETWRSRKSSLHSALVNNRIFTAELLNEYSKILAVNRFVVGHCHYRSGDTIQWGNNTITTVVSSSPYSPDAGHYMYEQMVVARRKMRSAENLPDGNAVAGYVLFSNQEEGERTEQFIMI